MSHIKQPDKISVNHFVYKYKIRVHRLKSEEEVNRSITFPATNSKYAIILHSKQSQLLGSKCKRSDSPLPKIITATISQHRFSDLDGLWTWLFKKKKNDGASELALGWQKETDYIFVCLRYGSKLKIQSHIPFKTIFSKFEICVVFVVVFFFCIFPFFRSIAVFDVNISFLLLSDFF